MTLLDVCRQCHSLTQRFLSLPASTTPTLASTQAKLTYSISIITTLLQNTPTEEIAVSFNGGKDCLVLLIVYLSTLFEQCTPLQLAQLVKVPCVFVSYETQFPALLDFIKASTTVYELQLSHYDNIPLKEGFVQFLSDFPQTKSIVIGQRRSDPFSSKLEPFQPTDNDWPSFQRVHPVLEWRYDEVWCFLKKLDIQYCELYDEGYTSLGGIANTVRNPALKLASGEYAPAYELVGENCDELERVGRGKSV